MTRLVIVESPTKAKTIRNFLPNGYRVEACMGHVRDLPSDANEIPESVKGQAWARLGVNVGDNFTPLYVIPDKKKKVVKALKDALKDAEELIVATDEDREGESIGWHLTQVLKPKVPVRRMVFHEITREAIQDALNHYRTIDDKLVRAQETRRILDRLVGYTVSPLLWKKIAPGLSAGRVQSVAVRLLVQREEQRRAFHSGTYWDVRAELALLNLPKSIFEAFLLSIGGVRIATGKDFDEATGKIAEGKKVLLLDEPGARALCDRVRDADWRVTDTAEKSQTRRPPPPFTTSTLQQEANRKLKLSARDTMRVAQKLYEEGHITYMRTDSVNLSNEAITAARKAIKVRYGENYLSPKPRQFTTKSKGAQEAHEAIRPAGGAMPTADQLRLTGTESALYEMIWKRTMATQMADAQLTLITVTIAVSDALFQANGRRIDFPGFFRVYVEGSDDPGAALDDRAVLLPPLAVGDPLRCKAVEALGHETQPPARYTEATLVQTLEREGVGRPSTYATIIGTIQDRDYAKKVGTQLVPTFTAFAVNRLLENHFPELVDTQFTARMEQTLDDIADGEAESLPYLRTFYLGDSGLETQVTEKLQTIDPREIYALALPDVEALVRIGRFGPYLEQRVASANGTHTGTNGNNESNGNGTLLRTSLPDSLFPGDLTDADAIRLLREKEKGPDTLGTDPVSGKPVLLLSGRFGPYVQLGTGEDAANGNEAPAAPSKTTKRASAKSKTAAKTAKTKATAKSAAAKPKRASLLKGMQPETLTLDTALALLSLPRTLGNDPGTGEVVEAGAARLGPFVRRGKEYRSLAANDDVLTVGLDRALELLREPKFRGGARASAKPLRELGAHPTDGKPVVVMTGRFGPYVKHGAINATLPRSTSPEAVTLDQALELIAARAAASPAKKGRGKTTKSTTGATSSGKKTTKTNTARKPAAKAKTATKPKASKTLK
ncbi:MAG: type I DNA topoisomerase [Aggregatilineales bacterium]